MFPAGATTITVTGTLPSPVGGTARKGRVVFTPSTRLVDSTQKAIYSGGGPAILDADGKFSVTLLCTDDTDVQPTGWRWHVDEQPSGGVRDDYWIDLPASLGPTVDLSVLAKVSAPDGTGGTTPTARPSGPAGGALTGTYPNPSLSSATIAAFDPAGAASSAQTVAAADATAKVAAHTAASDPHGDRAAAASALAAHAGDSTDVHGIADTAALETQTGAQTKASAAQAAATAAAATDATNKVSGHTAASDPHGDRSWADSKFATQLNLSALNGTVNDLSTTVTTIDGFLNDCLNRVAAIEQGTAFLAGAHFTDDVEVIDADLRVRGSDVLRASGDQTFTGELSFIDRIPVLPAFDAAFANQAVRLAQMQAAIAAAGGGSSVRTATVRVTDDNLSGLPAAASWTVVQTSTGTQLKASIAAAAGDRIRVYGAFMHIGSHFLDWVLLDNVGAIAVYATTDSGSAPGEGNPTMYPSGSFLRAGSPDMFTVSAGHIASGQATVALAHQGAGTGSGNIVYAHPTYPWRLRLENIGPEPA